MLWGDDRNLDPASMPGTSLDFDLLQVIFFYPTRLLAFMPLPLTQPDEDCLALLSTQPYVGSHLWSQPPVGLVFSVCLCRGC